MGLFWAHMLTWSYSTRFRHFSLNKVCQFSKPQRFGSILHFRTAQWLVPPWWLRWGQQSFWIAWCRGRDFVGKSLWKHMDLATSVQQILWNSGSSESRCSKMLARQPRNLGQFEATIEIYLLDFGKFCTRDHPHFMGMVLYKKCGKVSFAMPFLWGDLDLFFFKAQVRVYGLKDRNRALQGSRAP